MREKRAVVEVGRTPDTEDALKEKQAGDANVDKVEALDNDTTRRLSTAVTDAIDHDETE